MGQHKFKIFLKKQRWIDDVARQFADDAEADTTLPDAESWEQLETYLHEHEAGPIARSAARCVWEQYDKARHGRNV